MKMVSGWTLLLFIVTSCVVTCGTLEPKTMEFARYITRSSCRIKPGKVDYDLEALSAEHCTMQCSNTADCVSSSFNSGRY